MDFLQCSPPLLQEFNFYNFSGFLQPFFKIFDLKEFHEPFSPLQERRQTLLLLSFRVQHVVEELLPELDLPPALEGALDYPAVLHGPNLDILPEQEAVCGT